MAQVIHEVWRCAGRLVEIEVGHAAAEAAVPSGGASGFDRGLVTLWSWIAGVFLPALGADRKRIGLMRLFRGLPIIAVGSFLALGLAGCAPRSTPHQRSASSPSSRPIAETPPPPASTTHNWQYRVDQEYAYQGELSEDQKKAGQTSPTVQMYRYLGEHDGVFELQFDGETATCANPCQTINIRAGVFHVERLAFDPNTLIGAAFTDAFNGQMEIYNPAKRSALKGDGASR
jgi:hypothetical protein